MSWVWIRCWSKNRAKHGQGGAGLPDAGQLALEVRDVVLVQLDLLLVGLEALENALVVALAAQPLRFLLVQLLARLVEQLLLAGELLVEDPAAVVVPALLRIRFDLGEALGGFARL